MKIAKIFIGRPENRKGFFNNVIERTKHLIEVEPDVDCFIIRRKNGFILSLLKLKFKKNIKEEFVFIDGIKFRNLWITVGLLDYIVSQYFKRNITVGERQLMRYAEIFNKYDLLSPHGIAANFLAQQVKKQYSIPFVVTWHGSDINVKPFQGPMLREKIQNILDIADHNLFVSKSLLETSNEISITASKSVLYTGPSDIFYRFPKDRINQLRRTYNIRTTPVLGYIGNLVPIKNIHVLPEIFRKIQDSVPDASFVVVGNGELDNELRHKLKQKGIKNLHILGKLEISDMPGVMNCLDVLVLPSFNEGLPRVTLEAQACGVHVVGSNRGGIPEAIGSSNCFELDEDFVHKISLRILELLGNDSLTVDIPDKFIWSTAIEKEITLYRSISKDVR